MQQMGNKRVLPLGSTAGLSLDENPQPAIRRRKRPVTGRAALLDERRHPSRTTLCRRTFISIPTTMG
jgi:hypothetical protein